MLENIQIYFTLENIYTFANLGVIPFWLLLMFFPNETITKFIVHSVVAPLILSAAYIYIAIKYHKLNKNETMETCPLCGGHCGLC